MTKNLLSDLVGGPVNAYNYDCCHNPLTSLKGLPKKVNCFRLTLDMNLGLLSLITLKARFVFLNNKRGQSYWVDDGLSKLAWDTIQDFRERIEDGESPKKVILDAQKIFIDNKSYGNAKY